MNNATDRCDPALMDRFFDNEVDEAEGAWAKAHLAGCPSCRRFQLENQAIGDLFRSELDGVLTGADKTMLEEQVITQVGRHHSRGWGWLKELFAFKRLIPLAAVAGMLVLVFGYLFVSDVPAGPSAIVTSFQGDYSSVMIMETPETRNTIIWFVETTRAPNTEREKKQTDA